MKYNNPVIIFISGCIILWIPKCSMLQVGWLRFDYTCVLVPTLLHYSKLCILAYL